MNISILGVGTAGQTLGEAWSRKGHRIVYGVRDVNSEKARALSRKCDVRSIKAAAEDCDVVVLAVPWSGALETVKAAGNLAGKILVDPVNSFTPDMALSVGFSTSVAEEIAKAAPGAKVVKAFNSLGMNNVKNLTFSGHTASGFLCGDDVEAKAVVSRLAGDLGFDVVDCGSLKAARALEPLALLWGQLAFVQGFGPEIAFKLLRR